MKDIIIKQQAMDDLHFWAKNNLKLLRKIFELLKAIQGTPFTGIGKPEALKNELHGYWSRRINDEHRIVYKITDNALIIVSCRSHYKIN
jgi:toxin YoeB